MTRIAKRATELGIEITPFEAIATPPNGTLVYRIKDIFTVDRGNWDNGVERWARDAYLRPWSAPDRFDDAGADRNVFGRVEQPSGAHLRDARIHYWTYRDDGNHARIPVKQHSGWANIVMYGSSNYVRERGERGPWAWAVEGAYSDVVTGAGMPSNHHVSWFAVWQAVQYQAVTPPVVVDPPTTPDGVTKTEFWNAINAIQKQLDDMKALMPRWTGE